MNSLRRLLPILILLAFTAFAAAADWPPLTDADRQFTAVPGDASAPAVTLYREQIDDNMNNFLSVYERRKILTEAGRKYATVELPLGRTFNIDMVSGRTIHPDGSITPFQEKWIDQTITRDGKQLTIKTFTLPYAEVGSILDFRYRLRYMDFRVFPPEWDVQTDLFQRSAYFKFIPMQNRGYASVRLPNGELARNLAWTPFLGTDAKPEMHTLPAQTHATIHDVLLWVDLHENDVPAVVSEPFMPPVSMTRWRVYFYYQTTMKPDEFWRNQGKFWNKDVQRFLEKNDGVADSVVKITSKSDSDERNVKSIYSVVAALKHDTPNAAYSKERGYPLEYRSAECVMASGIVGIADSGGTGGCVQDQASPVDQKRRNRGVKDVLTESGGSHNELNRLFVAMVRAAGIPASLIWVTDRSEQAFLRDYMSTDQLDGEIAVVQLNNKDIFLDPGTKFCPYGLVDWRYSSSMGLRQNGNGGADIGQTPALAYQQSLVTRKIDLSLDSQGFLSGSVALYLSGVPAMLRRQAADRLDANAKKQFLENELAALLGPQSHVELANSPDWNSADPELMAQFRIKIPVPPSDPKTLNLPEYVFHSNDKLLFPASTRSNAIEFRYPWQEADEVRVSLPPGFTVAKLPPDESFGLPYARYRVQRKQESADKLYARRDFIMGINLLLPEKYKEVKDFFDKINANDIQPAVLSLSTNAAAQN